MPDAPEVARFRCPSCGADMEFNPESGGLLCRFCGHAEPLAATRTIGPEHSLEAALADPAAWTANALTGKAQEVSCNSCGSVVVFEPPEVAGACPFCGTAIVAQPKAADPLIAPDAVLPFKAPRRAAQNAVREWIASRWFAPNALKRLAQQEGIAGVYLPFWTYSADTESRYVGSRGEHYWVTEYYTDRDERGNIIERSRQVQRTRWYPASGRVSRRFNDVLVPATRSVNEKRLNALEPWDLEQLCAYEPAYLAGFKAQRYQLDLPEGFEEAKQVMAETIEQDVLEDIGGDEQRIDHIETEHSNVTFRHLLLPVWIGAYRFQGKVYQVAVNARTGEVQGERPYSAWKITAFVLFIAVIVLILVVLTRQ